MNNLHGFVIVNSKPKAFPKAYLNLDADVDNTAFSGHLYLQS